MMYRLLVHSLDIQRGSFIRWWDNVVAFQPNIAVELPMLRHDRGDLDRLRPFFPVDFKNKKCKHKVINWEWKHHKPGLRERIREAIIGKTLKIRGIEIRFL
jgi:hypothetical protein